jgi:hypothetical protein
LKYLFVDTAENILEKDLTEVMKHLSSFYNTTVFITKKNFDIANTLLKEPIYFEEYKENEFEKNYFVSNIFGLLEKLFSIVSKNLSKKIVIIVPNLYFSSFVKETLKKNGIYSFEFNVKF